jgi:hypothetical protein
LVIAKNTLDNECLHNFLKEELAVARTNN